MTLLTQPGPLHRHVDHETGTILRIDPITGAVISCKDMVRRTEPRTEFDTWAAKRRSEDLSDDYAIIQSNITKVEPVAEAVEPISKQGRGRPKTTYVNPVAAFMPFLVIPNPLRWVDDIITGSLYTSAGVSNGKINVKARAVIGALFLSEITAEACQTSEISLRTAQRIAKAARHASHGIASYVARYPKIKAELETETTAETLLRSFQD